MNGHDLRIRDVGEAGLLRRIARWLDPPPRGTLGLGDDAALISVPPRDALLLTTDALCEGTHFRRTWSTPEEVGAKALAVNLSDAAAMGGRPSSALVSLILPPQTRVDAVRRLYAGMRRAARRAEIQILGGNLARGDTLSITVFLLGRVPKGKARLRSGSRPGDRVYMTGQPGLARLGLALVARFARGGPDLWRPGSRRPAWRGELVGVSPWAGRAARRFLEPEPRLGASAALRPLAPTSLIDVSDGLAADLRHLAEAGARLEIDASRLPLPSGYRRLALALGLDPLTSIWQGGEDYELLFTLPPRAAKRLGPRAVLAGVPAVDIGEVVKGRPGVFVRADGVVRPLTARGFEHFEAEEA